MDEEDGRCLLDVICDPQALNDFLHGSETQEHVPEVQPPAPLSTSEPTGLPRVSVDLDFLEDDDILGGSPGGEGDGGSESNGVGANHEPCDILQQSLAEANITEQSLQEAEAELDLSSFGLSNLAQVVQPLPDGALPGVGIGGNAQIFPGQGTITTPSSASTDMLGSVLAHPGLQLQPQVMNKAINVQPFMQQVGLGNVTLQSISSLQALPNGGQSGHLGIGQIQVVGQPTVMTINSSGQQILAKSMNSYQLNQPGLDAAASGAQAGLGGSVLNSGGGLLIQGGKPTLNGPVATSSSSSGTTIATPTGIVGFTRGPLNAGIGAQAPPQNQIMQNVIIQRTPTPIQPKPPGTIQPKLFNKQAPQQQVQQVPTSHTLQNDSNKALGVQQVPVTGAQNVAFLTGKPSSNVVLSTQTTTPGAQFPQALFKQHGTPTSGKPLSVHLLNQQGSIVIPSQAVLQGQNHQFLLPQLQAGGQILTQQPGGHIITSSGAGQIITANQILTTNQNINIGQVLASQGHPGAAHILSGPIQLQHGQMGHPTLFQMPVSLAQTQNQAHSVTGHVQTVIQGMPIQNSLSIEGLSPAVSLQSSLQQPQQPPSSMPATGSGVAAMAQCQPGEAITVLGSATEQAAQTQSLSQASIPPVQTGPAVSAAMLIPSSASPSSSVTTTTSSVSTVGITPQGQHSPGKVLFTPQSSSIIVSQEPVQMFLQQVSSAAHHQALKLQSASPSHSVVTRSATPTLSDSPQQSRASPLTLGHSIQSPHSRPPSQPPAQPPPLQSQAPSSIPPLFIIHNPIGGSPQPPQPAAQLLQPQTHPAQIPQVLPQPLVLKQEPTSTSSGSPKPPQVPPAQFQFVAPAVGTAAGTVLKQQPPGLTAEQQHHLQYISAQLQTMTSIVQPSPQQKQLLEKLNQVQQNILLQAKDPQPQAASQFSKLPEQPTAQVVTTSASGTITSPVPSLLQQKSVLVKTSAAGSNDTQVFSGTSGPSGVTINQGKAPPALTKTVQAKSGVINAVGGVSLGQPGLQIQVLNSRITQMSGGNPSLPVPPQNVTLKRPFIMEPSKEARMLEQLRKLQGSVLHPDYSSPFSSFEDSLNRLLPYHLYQGVTPSTQDYQKVDDEFENISSQLLKRTQAMLDKYRHLLFEESRQRLGPSAEMVMIDRMFIQEEKVALNQDRILAKEKPEEFAASASVLSRTAESGVRPANVESSMGRTGPPAVEPVHMPVTSASSSGTPVVSATPTALPTKLVIKQGGGGASVSWSTSCTTTPAVVRPGTEHTGQNSERCSGRTPSSTHSAEEDDDALPQRTSKPPIKTYEARQRIGLKLKIKQEAGFSKVVHNTALDPVHLQPQHTPLAQPPESSSKTEKLPVTQQTTVIRTSALTCNSTSSSTFSVVTTQSGSATSTVPRSSASHTWSAVSSVASASCTSSAQVNGTLEHYEAPKPKTNSTSTATSQATTCRLPLRKTYRENISPRHRPGVLGGGDVVPIPSRLSPEHLASSPKPERTVIASVKLEQQGGTKFPHANTDSGSQALAAVQNEFYSGIKNARHPCSDNEDDEDDSRKGRFERLMWQTSKKQERAIGMFRRDQHAPGPPSPGETSWARDSSLPAKRSKSDSPDMDNASFSSGSPPLDNSLNEHLQSAIDSILNLQQGLPSRTSMNRVHASSRHQTHHGQGAPSSSSAYRHSVTSSSSSSSDSIPQHPQLGGRGQNGSLLSQSDSR